MSMATLERAFCAGARVILKNPKLRVKDIMEWRTSKIEPQDGEVVVYVSDPGGYVAVKKEVDKRK